MWSFEEVNKLVDLFNQGLTDKEIAKHLPNRTRDAVERKRIQIDLLKDGYTFPDKVLLEKLEKFCKEFYAEHGRYPYGKDITNAEGLPCSQTFSRRFGNLAIAYIKAGIPPNVIKTDETLKIGLFKLAKELGRLPKHDEILNCAYTGSPSTYYNRIEGNSLEEVFEWAGLKKSNLGKE